jgi:hypothetical protein
MGPDRTGSYQKEQGHHQDGGGYRRQDRIAERVVDLLLHRAPSPKIFCLCRAVANLAQTIIIDIATME